MRSIPHASHAALTAAPSTEDDPVSCAKSLDLRSRRFAIRGVPLDRLAISVAASAVHPTPSLAALRTTMTESSASV